MWRAVLVCLIPLTCGCASTGRSPFAGLVEWAGTRQDDSAAEEPGPSLAEKKISLRLASAKTREAEQNWEAAAQAYRQILADNPQHATATWRLAVVSSRQGRLEEADGLYRQAARQLPDDPELSCDLGYNCYLQQRWDEAEAEYRRALQLAPGSRRAHTNLGTLLARHGRFEEAFAEFRSAGCSPAEAKSNLAFALLVQERWDEATGLFQQALADDPKLEHARRGIAAVDRARNQLAARPLREPEQRPEANPYGFVPASYLQTHE